ALGAASPTNALSDGFEVRSNAIADYLAAFKVQPGQIGVIYKIDDVLAGSTCSRWVASGRSNFRSTRLCTIWRSVKGTFCAGGTSAQKFAMVAGESRALSSWVEKAQKGSRRA